MKVVGETSLAAEHTFAMRRKSGDMTAGIALPMCDLPVVNEVFRAGQGYPAWLGGVAGVKVRFSSSWRV